MKTTRPSDFSVRSLRVGDSVRAVAKMVPTSEGGNERRCVVIARPRPREQPVMR